MRAAHRRALRSTGNVDDTPLAASSDLRKAFHKAENVPAAADLRMTVGPRQLPDAGRSTAAHTARSMSDRSRPGKRHSSDRLPRHSYDGFAFDTSHFDWEKAAAFLRRLSNRIFNARR